MSRIGVFICQCGVNIAEKVDTEKVAEEISKLPSVEHATDYKFMCSSPGQKLIKDAINEHGLDRVIVAACSPQMHQQTFQRAIESEGLNPYFLSIANIREQCSWVTEDPEKATEKAINLVRKKVKRVTHHDSLEDIEVPITKKALIVGGGIAGIQAALDIAESGKEVILVEREPSLGGRMAQL
ncbi:disulfide reductase, partial [candidate division MSBL1 archaeon SCGC-AAA259I09]